MPFEVFTERTVYESIARKMTVLNSSLLLPFALSLSKGPSTGSGRTALQLKTVQANHNDKRVRQAHGAAGMVSNVWSS
jgi:hypothetical protein